MVGKYVAIEDLETLSFYENCNLIYHLLLLENKQTQNCDLKQQQQNRYISFAHDSVMWAGLSKIHLFLHHDISWESMNGG